MAGDKLQEGIFSKLTQAVSLFEQLKKEMTGGNLKKSGEILEKLKISLVHLSFLKDADQKELMLTREILEMGVQWSIRSKDTDSFERYIAQLRPYYAKYYNFINVSDKLPASQRMYTLIGLNLLRLLSQSRLSEFHSEIETLDADIMHSNLYIKHPVQVEQYLMEGSYNKIYQARLNVPAQEYLFFMEILVGTIRNEISSCFEDAYESLPLSDAATLLYLKGKDEALVFARDKKWRVEGERIIFSKKTSEAKVNVDAVISQTLEYAHELERIV
jgi:26S proteasome regulatory subunit N12